MAIKHNQQIPNNHFRKDWQRRVRCHFDQPGRKLRRRRARLAKVAKVAPRPVDKLRPVVRCPTLKYNRRVRAGRGFTLEELKEAGIPKKFAPTIGIAVDHRRRNLSVESLTVNVDRLKSYKARLIIFPQHGKRRSGDSSAEDLKAVQTGGGLVRKTRHVFRGENPTTKSAAFDEVKRSELGTGDENAYKRLRTARSDARLVGVRDKRAKAKADEAAATKK
ncbi:MAG: 60S ribosomal protein L13 [Lichina confinis]|nr:MAG: 60S ribosomal protein L13 [Lichina confinis]